MHLPVMRTGLVGLTALIALVAAFAAVLYSGSGNNAEAATYTPTSAVKMCNALAADFPSSIPANDADLLGNPACADVLTASANTNFTVTFSVPGGDSNFGSSVITNVPGTTAVDAGIPDGQKVGGLRSDVTLSLLNGPCGTALVAEFVLYDSETTGAATAVQAEGTTNRWSDIVTDANLDEIGDSTSTAITTNLNIYETLFTPTGGAYIPPSARYTGLTRVPSGGDWQLLSFFQVSAGALDAFNNASDSPHTFARVSHAPTTGNLSLSILNDPTATLTSVSPIHDFCAPLIVQTMLLGMTPGGSVRYTTPTAGTMGVSNFSYGQRDLDGDGLENAFDTCAAAANTGTDTDGDGIDNVCDPTVGTNTGLGDHDSDGFANRQDNCPLVANGVPLQTDAEVSTANVYTSVAPDGGSKSDSIGDACETDDLVANGAFVEAYNLAVKCIGATDADGDGYCAAQDVDDAVFATKGFAVNGGIDSEYKFGAGGGQGDKVGGNWEVYLGSDPLKRCGFTAGGQVWSENWPYDLVENNAVNISDELALKPVFSGTVPAVDKHFDIVPNKAVNISDVLALKPVFSSSCTP